MKNDSDLTRRANVKAHYDRYKEFLGIYENLSNAIATQQEKKAIIGTLDALLHFVETHFATEEQEMRNTEYREFEAHVAEHKLLLDQLDLFFHKHSLEMKPIHFEMLSFLKDWINDHILGSDKKYSLTLQQSGIAAN